MTKLKAVFSSLKKYSIDFENFSQCSSITSMEEYKDYAHTHNIYIYKLEKEKAS